jgi:hypothetical protein
MDGLRMSREEECAMGEEIGVLCSGKRFWCCRKRIVVDREEKHSKVEERDIGVVIQIIPCTGQTLHQTHDPMCISEN